MTERIGGRLRSSGLPLDAGNLDRALAAMEAVPRERFVPEGYGNLAYLPMSGDIGHGQTISKPDVVAAMTAAAVLDGESNLLEVGTGSGYGAAVLARIAGRVHTVEIVPALARRAGLRLAGLGCRNVRVVEGDGGLGLPDRGPFDAIVVTAGSDAVPTALTDQLAVGGRLVMPVGPAQDAEELLVVRRRPNGLERASLGRVCFVPLTGACALRGG